MARRGGGHRTWLGRLQKPWKDHAGEKVSLRRCYWIKGTLWVAIIPVCQSSGEEGCEALDMYVTGHGDTTVGTQVGPA